MQIVFQDPFASLNRRQDGRADRLVPADRPRAVSSAARQRDGRVAELLELVGLRPAHAAAYPRQLSGGQCQRVSIARALALNPSFVVLDEAVSAVDVSIQAQILNLLRDLQERLSLTYLFVTHDLAVVRYMADTIAVMYLGRIVELAPRDALFESPQHPYTHALLSSIPPAPGVEQRTEVVLREAPASDTLPSGCRFHPRCPLGHRSICRTVDPPLQAVGDGHTVACHFPQSAESLRRRSRAGASMSTVHAWDALTREEIGELAPDALLVLPVGTTEQHGPHLATGTDALIATVVAERAAAAASQARDDPARPDARLRRLRPSPALRRDAVARRRHLRAGPCDLLASAAAAGVRRVFVLNAHGGNAAACAVAVAEASREHGLIAGNGADRRRLDRTGAATPASGRPRSLLALDAGPRADGSRDALARWRGADAAAGRRRRRAGTLGGARRLHRHARRGDGGVRRAGAWRTACAAAAAAFEHLADIGG